jgi:hypothetical protein
MNNKYFFFTFKILVVLCLVLSSYYTLYAFSAQVCYYVIKTGTSEHYGRWQLEKDINYVNTFETYQKRDTTIIQPEMDTVMWKLESPAERTDISASKEGNAIDLEGKYKGEFIHKTIQIDENPWFQSIAVSLRSIASSCVSKVYFWSIRPENLKAYKLVATKKDDQLVWLGGQQIKASRVEIRPFGLLAPLWKCDCWFSEDGIFLKYKGAGWPPGSPDTEIEFREVNPELAKHNCSMQSQPRDN